MGGVVSWEEGGERSCGPQGWGTDLVGGMGGQWEEGRGGGKEGVGAVEGPTW